MNDGPYALHVELLTPPAPQRLDRQKLALYLALAADQAGCLLGPLDRVHLGGGSVGVRSDIEGEC